MAEKNFMDLLGEQMQAPMFQMGAGLFASGSRGEDIGTGLLSGTQAAAAASKQQMAFRKAKKEQENDEARQAMWSKLNAGGQPPEWAKGLPPGVVDMALGMGPEAGSQLITQMMLKNADRDLDIRRLEQDAGFKREELALKRAQGGEGNYGKTGAIFQDPKTGGYYSVQFGADGRKLIEPIGDGLSPSRGVTEVDTGTGTRIIDKATGADIRSIDKDIAGAAAAAVTGRDAAEKHAAMPKMMASLESARSKSDLVRAKIKQAIPMVNNWTVSYGSMLKDWPGGARDLKEVIAPIIANLGFDELQDMRANSPTGGALGGIAVQELEMLQRTKTSLDQAQSVPQMLSALKELDEYMVGASARRERAFQLTYNQGPAQPQPQAQPQQHPRGAPSTPYGQRPASMPEPAPAAPPATRPGFKYIGRAQ